MAPQSPTSGRTRGRRKVIGYVLPGLIVGLVTLAARVAEDRFGAPPWVTPAAALAAFIGITPLLLKWWEAFDEVARDAHRDSWLWGGTAGLCLSVVIFLGVTNYSDALRLSDVGGVELFTLGAASVFVPVMLGYVICWAAWWLRRR